MTIIAEVNSLTVPAQIFNQLSVNVFRLFPASGDATDPENINDNTTGTIAVFTINEYATIELPGLFKITQYRHYGNGGNDGDGAWKLEYQDYLDAWHDWATGIATRVAATWCDWVTASEVLCKAIRLTCTTADGGVQSRLPELEVKY